MDKNQKEKEKKQTPVTIKLAKVRAMKALSNPDSNWTLTQEILQDILANLIVKDPDSKPKSPEMVKMLKEEIKERYKDDVPMQTVLLDSVPQGRAIIKWVKKDGWQQAVWDRIHSTGLFTPETRATMIKALYERGLNKSDSAAKIWLTLSGDYSDKLEVNDNALDKYREINKVLLKSKEEQVDQKQDK